MNNSKKETISTSKKIICVVTVIIAIAAAFGLIYGIVRANSMIIFQASSLAAIDTVTICLNSRNHIMFECENTQTLGNVSLVCIDKLRYNMST